MEKQQRSPLQPPKCLIPDRRMMTAHGPLPSQPPLRLLQAVALMRDHRFQPVVMGLLYHVSMEDKYKSMFTYTDAIPIILEVPPVGSCGP